MPVGCVFVNKATAFQLNLAELTSSKNPAERQIIDDVKLSTDGAVSRPRRKRSAPILALLFKTNRISNLTTTHSKLGVTLCKGSAYSFSKMPSRTTTFSGFCLYDETFPVIYVNNSSSKTRQIFTLFHELAHLLFQTSGIDTISSDYIDRLGGKEKSIEVFCNTFATSSAATIPRRLESLSLFGTTRQEKEREQPGAHAHHDRALG